MKFKKLLAAVVSGALAVMSLASLPVSAADSTLTDVTYTSATNEKDGTISYTISIDELDKYESITLTYNNESKGDGTYNANSSYAVIGIDANNNGWYIQPTNAMQFCNWAATETQTVTKTVEEMKTSITSSQEWTDGGFVSLTAITLAPWNGATNAVIKGTLKPTEPDTRTNLTIQFKTSPIELTVGEANWDPAGKSAQANTSVTCNDIGKTYAEFKAAYKTIELTGITHNNNSADVDPSKIMVTPYAKWTSGTAAYDGDLWSQGNGTSISSSTTTWNVDGMKASNAAIPDSATLYEVGFQININGSDIGDAAIGDKITVNAASTPVDPDGPNPPTPDNPPAPSGDAVTLWEETPVSLGAWANSIQLDTTKVANIKAGDKLKVTYTLDSGKNEISFKHMGTGWPGLTGAEYIEVTSSPYEYTIVAGDIENIHTYGIVVGGQNLTISKIELIPGSGSTEEPDPVTLTISQESASLTTGGTVTLTTTPAEGVTWATSNADVATVSGGVVTAVGAGTATITATLGEQTATCTVTVTAPAPVVPQPVVPSIPSYPSVFPSYTVTTPTDEPQLSDGAVGQGWNAIEDKISETADGGKVTVDMNGATTLPKEVLDNISGEDVDLVLNMKGGVTWTINGTDVDKASDIDMKVTVGTRAIPEEAIEAVEGGKSVKQISLAHNGTFGFTATMTISLGKLNDGQYANLFYYNPKSKSLEFVDASIISGGKANLIFNHASDCAIIMSDAPLGDYEDVSAAAGVISSESADTTVFFACGAVVLAVAAAYAIYRKRSRG